MVLETVLESPDGQFQRSDSALQINFAFFLSFNSGATQAKGT